MNTEPTIAETAGLCFNAFQQCLEKSAFISPREMSRVEDQFARFSLWTANIGVFASGRASLDHRLREAQEVHEVITSLLEVLDDKIKECISYLKSFIEPEGDDSLELDQEKLDKHIQGLANQITLLHRLSNTIRKASSETQNAKAANTFKILDDEGNDVEPLLKIIFANYVRDKFRSINEEILQRLVSAMITRRKRVLYKRSRFGNLALRVKETKPRPKVQAPQTQPQKAPATQKSPQAENKEDDTGANHKSQTGVSATTLAADKFKKASAPSVISGTKTVAFDNHEDLPFPLPPLGRVRRKYKKMKRALEEQHERNLTSLAEGSRSAYFDKAYYQLKTGFKFTRDLHECWDQCLRAVGEVTCPFCFYAISVWDISDDNKWRSHVRNDLDAYICLFEQCNDQDKLFGRSEEWLRHMREHALRWPCNSKSHGNIIFDSRDEYIHHLQEAHKSTFSDAQLRVLADRNARTIGPLFKSCPFCGFDDTSSGTKIEDHIVGHLRFLALKSLPPYEDERSESSDAESTSSRTSKARKRSTVENDPDKEVKTDFEDNGPIVLLDSDDESIAEPVLTSQYIPRRRNMEWGFITETFDEILNVDDDTVLQHIAAKQAHQSNDERSSDKGKHGIIEVTTEGSSVSQFLTFSRTETESTPGSRFLTLFRPSESRSLRSLSEGLSSPKVYWNAPYQIHDGKDQKDDEEIKSPVPIIDTSYRRTWFTSLSEERRYESTLTTIDVIEPERRRDAHSPRTRPIEKMFLRNKRHDDKDNRDHHTPLAERREVDRISETPTAGKIPSAVPRQRVEDNSILVNIDASNQQPALLNPYDSLLDDMIRRLLASTGSSSKALCLSDTEITLLCMESRAVLLSQPVLLELKAPVKIVGDIHGQYTDLLRMFELSGYPPHVNYLFLGDYVDRGKLGLETILLLLCYKIKYPENFFLLRGNHECANVTRVYGFYDECKRRCSLKIWKTFVDVFNCLPVAAIISDKIFCVHGGLSPSLGHMNDVRAIVRPTDIPDYGLLNDLLWSDPALMDQDWEPNERGVSYTFGKNVIREFLTKFDFDLICRAHMVVEDGYEFYEDRLLVTIFTAPNYCGEFDNWGAIMSVSEDLLCSFELLKPLSAEAKPLKAAKSLTANLLDRWKKWTAPPGK